MNQPINRVEQAAKAELFRAMHSGPQLLLLPNAWDAISARIVVEELFSNTIKYGYGEESLSFF